MHRKSLFTGYLILFLTALALPALARAASPSPYAHLLTPARKLRGQYDVIVVGAGTGGTAAALQATRLGASVLLLEPTDWIGGQMAAAAVSSMDEGYPPRSRVRERGIYGEFRRRAVAFYQALGLSTDTCAITEDHFAVEPRIAQKILFDMIQDTRRCRRPDGSPAILDVSLRTEVTQVQREGQTVRGVTVKVHNAGRGLQRKIAAHVVIDATEYGDVIPLAGVPYRAGNWRSEQELNRDQVPPVQPITWTAVIREYPGGAPSDLLMKQPPPGYDVRHYQGSLSNSGDGTHRRPWDWARFLKYRGMPDSASQRKAKNGTEILVTRTHANFDPNDHHYDVLDLEDRRKREQTEYEARLKTLGLIYYFQQSMGITNWSVADDEGYDTPYNREQNERLIRQHPELAPFRRFLDLMPVIPYVRESRRILGLYTMSAKDIRRKKPHTPVRFPTSVALGDYPIDVHGGPEQAEWLEPDLEEPADLPIKFASWGYGAFQIPFESFIPVEVDGFLPAEKNLSQSRLVSGATRLQPSTMLTGQAAGAIAGLAVRLNRQPREVPPLLVQTILLEAGSTLSRQYYSDLLHGSEVWKAVQLATTYGVLDYPEPYFSVSKPVTPDEVQIAQARLRELQLRGANSPWDPQLPEGLTTREQLARAVAKVLQASLGSLRARLDTPTR